jgi:hypothetical protein
MEKEGSEDNKIIRKKILITIIIIIKIVYKKYNVS